MTTIQYSDPSISGSTTPALPKTPVLGPTDAELLYLQTSPLSSGTVTHPNSANGVAVKADGDINKAIAAATTMITTTTVGASATTDTEYDDDDMPLFSLGNRSVTVATSRSSQKSMEDAPTSDTLVASPGVDRKMCLTKDDFVSVHALSQEDLVDGKKEDDDEDEEEKNVECTTNDDTNSKDTCITSPKLSSFGTYPLYVGDLHPDVTEALLYSVFGVCGSISSVRICRDAMTQASLGYAYVNFQTKEAADKALKDLNYSKILTRECRIMPAINRSETQHLPPGSNIYVYHLHPSIESKALYDRFSQYGKVVSCKVVRNVHTGQSMCRGYVQFGTRKEADDAIAAENGKLFCGGEIRVDSFLSREERLSTFTSKKAPAGILNVCGISPHCTEAELKKVFGMFGSIHSVYFTLNFNPRFVSSGGGYAINGGTGWGYVNYYEASAARVARSVLNEVILKGVKLSVMERHDAGFHSDEPLQFTVVVRTFDKTIVMENIEDMVKDSVPLIEISSASFKVYSRIEGASVQCATITALSFDESEAIISGINAPSSPWRSLVACHAGQEAIKFRPRYGYYYKHDEELGGGGINGGDEGRPVRGVRFGRQQQYQQNQQQVVQQQQQRRFDDGNNSGSSSSINNNNGNNNSNNYHRNGSIGRRDYYSRRGHYGDNHNHHNQHHRNWRNKNDDGRQQQQQQQQQQASTKDELEDGQPPPTNRPVSLPPKPREELVAASSVCATIVETADGFVEGEVGPPKGPAAQQTNSVVAANTSTGLIPTPVYGGDAGYFGGWPIVDGGVGAGAAAAAAVAAAAAATTSAYYGQYAAMYPHPHHHHHGYAAYYQYPTQEAYIGFPMGNSGGGGVAGGSGGDGNGNGNGGGSGSGSGVVCSGGTTAVGGNDITGNACDGGGGYIGGGSHQALMMTQLGQRYHHHYQQQQQQQQQANVSVSVSVSGNGNGNRISDEASTEGNGQKEEDDDGHCGEEAEDDEDNEEEEQEEEEGERQLEEDPEEEEDDGCAEEGKGKGRLRVRGGFCGNGSKGIMMMMQGHQRHYQQGQQYYGGGRRGSWKREEVISDEKIPREPKVAGGGGGRYYHNNHHQHNHHYHHHHHHRQYEKRRGRGGGGGSGSGSVEGAGVVAVMSTGSTAGG